MVGGAEAVVLQSGGFGVLCAHEYINYTWANLNV